MARIIAVLSAAFFVSVHAAAASPITVNFYDSLQVAGSVQGPIVGSFSFDLPDTNNTASNEGAEWIGTVEGGWDYGVGGLPFRSSTPHSAGGTGPLSITLAANERFEEVRITSVGNLMLSEEGIGPTRVIPSNLSTADLLKFLVPLSYDQAVVEAPFFMTDHGVWYGPQVSIGSVISIASVDEPGTAILLIAGLVGFALFRARLSGWGDSRAGMCRGPLARTAVSVTS